MRLPIIPLIFAALIFTIAVYLFNTAGRGGDHRTLDAPQISRIADLEGVETEVALSPDGSRCALILDGDMWMLNVSDGTRVRMTESAEPESFPAWSPDGKRVTFTRGADTYVLPADTAAPASGEAFKGDAVSLSWSPSGRLVYVRQRALWLTDIAGRNDRQIYAADDNPNVTLRAPRFSPDSLQIAFIKSLLNLSGQVWTVDALNGTPRALVSDRPIEDPLDVGWILDGRELVYLTNRSGAYTIWHVNFADNTLAPLTQPLSTALLAPIGMTVWKDRIILPRHFLNSNIALSDGTAVVHSEELELEPAVSGDGKLVAYTVLKDNQSDIWTAGIDGSNPTFRTVGHEPRFTPDGFHLVYTHADLAGNDDVWRLDIRNGSIEHVTDADELDLTPDASTDGRLIAFSSTRSVAPSVWIISASGGKRLRLNDGGYAPRFSPDGKLILFWNKGEFWTMDAGGGNIRGASLDPAPVPSAGGWLKAGPLHQAAGPLQMLGSEIRTAHGISVFKSGRPLWPGFDVMPDGRFLIAPIAIRETSLWALDLKYRTQ